MGEHEVWSHPGDLLLNGLLPDEASNVTRVLDADRWGKAEERVAELLACMQPNGLSEERRNAVANYVQRLIMKCFTCEVFTFGSVPLKTYLPDGDIDLTAFSKNEELKDSWANDVREVLENEERSESAEFRVKEVQYIQAEVKIIKCLVENIVVDISFNQVGGLCTLCFLEEIDHLINQNHLFKRSIILIKAWCYYESRILGAHHGLISTYALETLVLYIFHVFNNCFAGPLEVLYRFLEFFSHFDWDNFCVSLWGPVPISSLPEMAAESPRKDGGELLLNGIFLEACSSVYAVFPSSQESQSQQFVPKHFNVIDPLRTNNNLGRSVSKGNFYRIRSAFAFGAKRLAKLLDCPEEDVFIEVNQFFMNTWERHGSGSRPDAPSQTNRFLRPLKIASIKEQNHDSVSQAVHTSAQNSPNAYRMSNSSIVSRGTVQKDNAIQISSRDADQPERNHSPGASVKPDKNTKNLKPNYTDSEGRGCFQFVRTQSSPDLTDTSVDIPPRMRRSRVAEANRTFKENLRSECGPRRRNTNYKALSTQNVSFSAEDPPFYKQSSSNQSLEGATDSNSASNSHHDDAGFTTVCDELASVSESLELQQDMVNMMASSRGHNLIGQVQLPMHLSTSHPSVHLSPYLASMGYSPRNLLSLIDPSWGSTMQFPQGFVSAQRPHYFPNNLKLNSDEIEISDEISPVNTVIQDDDEHDEWNDCDVGSVGGFESDNGGFRMLRSNDRPHSSASQFSYASSSRVNNSGASVARGHRKIAMDGEGSKDDYFKAIRQPTGGTNDLVLTDRNASSRYVPIVHVSSGRHNSYSEPSRDGTHAGSFKLTRNKWGRNSSTSEAVNLQLRKTKNEWHHEVASEPALLSQQDEDGRGWVASTSSTTNISDRAITSVSSISTHSKSHFSGYEQAQMRGADSMIPFTPMLVGNSQQKLAENSGVIPFAFYPTGPPVPFVTMVPIYNFPTFGSNSDCSTKDDDAENLHSSSSDQNFNSNYDQFDGHVISSASKNAVMDSSEEHKPDILNSDFASHWQNLQYGRFCQNAHNYGPLAYSPPLMVPPVYLQGHFPMDGPGRPYSANMGFFTQAVGYGPRLIPIAALQQGPSRPSGAFRRYGDDSPRYRSGTGTYLPNPKASFRERQFSNTGNHRGSYKHDRADQPDREGSWINSKARSVGRGHARNQNERSNFRSIRSASSDNRHWDSYRHDQFAPHNAQNVSFRSSNSSNDSMNSPSGFYPMTGGGANGAGSTLPPVVTLYPYEHGASYGSPAEPLEFGSCSSVHQSNNDRARSGDGNAVMNRMYDSRHGSNRGGDSSRSSPDRPSSPHIPR